MFLFLVAMSGELQIFCNKTQDEIKQEVESGKLKKVQICKYIDRKPDETNAYYHTEITKAISSYTCHIMTMYLELKR